MTPQEAEAIRIVDEERRSWQRAIFFVTKDVAFDMRLLIESNRKNFWGVYEKPIDEATGREKMWIPMTMRDVEIMWKNSDIDLKDMMFRAKHDKAVISAQIARYVVKNELEKMFFGETLDETLRQMLIDGTVVWKTWEENGKLRRRTVDLLNCFIDPTAQSIQDAYRFTERARLLPSQIAQMSGWSNTKGIKGKERLDEVAISMGTSTMNRTTGKYQDVWEMWGMIPKWLVTDQKDHDEEAEGHIVVSGIEAGDQRVHLIELNTKKDNDGVILKPYEEGRLAKIAGRWYGLGIPERELALQEWLNTSTNLRINRQYIAQLGLFKLRAGSGVTPQMVSNLASSGIIPVNNMDDFQPLAIPPPDPSAYNDEAIIKEWAQAITQAYPIASGESLPASQTATASSIQNSNAKTSFSMVKDAMEFLLKRWMDRHAMPIIAKGLKVGDVVRVMNGMDGYQDLAEQIVAHYAQEWMDEYGSNIDPQSMQRAMSAAIEELKRRPQLFLECEEEILTNGLEVSFYTNDESLDTQSTVQNLIAMSQADPEARESYMQSAMDLMGLARPSRKPQPQPGTPGIPGGQTVQDKTQLTYGAGQGNSAAVTQG